MYNVSTADNCIRHDDWWQVGL